MKKIVFLVPLQKSGIEAVTTLPENDHKTTSCFSSAKDSHFKKNPFSFTVIEDWSTYHIIDVCRNNVLFKTFAKVDLKISLFSKDFFNIFKIDFLIFVSQDVLKTTVWAVSLACEQSQTSEPSAGIVSKILKTQKPSKQLSKSVSDLAFGSANLVGVSFCFGGTDAYYLSLAGKSEECVVSLKDRLELLRKILQRDGNGKQPVAIGCCFDVKEQFKMLFR